MKSTAQAKIYPQSNITPADFEQTDKREGVVARSRILATGSALPSKKITNKDLEEILDTSDEWIKSRVGIECRYVCDSHESCVTLARDASLQAFEAASITPDKIDLVIFATVTPDRPLPSAAALLSRELGIENALAFDLKAACSGFIFALATADSLLQSLGLQRALVIGAESLSRITDWRDRNTAVLFGDGAGACILERNAGATESCIQASFLRTSSEGADFIQQGDSSHFPKPYSPATLFHSESSTQRGSDSDTSTPYIQMRGREVFKGGVEFMTKSILEVLKSSDKTIEDIDLFIPHQSNARMVRSVCQNVGLTDESKVALNIQDTGNTSAASIPIALDQANRNGKIQRGNNVLLTAVGSGMTYGSILLEW